MCHRYLATVTKEMSSTKDDVYVASEVEAQNGVVHDVPGGGPLDRPLRNACCDSVGIWSVVHIVVKHPRGEIAADYSQQGHHGTVLLGAAVPSLACDGLSGGGDDVLNGVDRRSPLPKTVLR
uniref:Uncharacterized protein n=1 Tax=Trichogramma kaykai TaxID=54128 RepID=A0ABD2W7U1_9HYME